MLDVTGAQTGSWRPRTSPGAHRACLLQAAASRPSTRGDPQYLGEEGHQPDVEAKPFGGNSPLIRYVLEMSENSKVSAPAPRTRPGRAARLPSAEPRRVTPR